MTSPFARGACPRLSAPMPTGDGLLARLKPTGPIPLDAFIALAAAAAAHGNGTIEVTARGSLQLRGLSPDSAPLLADEVSRLPIALAEGPDVISDPLPHNPLSVIDLPALAASLREAIAGAGLELAPKVSVVVDGGGRLHLDALAADLRLRALANAARRQAPPSNCGGCGSGNTARPGRARGGGRRHTLHLADDRGERSGGARRRYSPPRWDRGVPLRLGHRERPDTAPAGEA